MHHLHKLVKVALLTCLAIPSLSLANESRHMHKITDPMVAADIFDSVRSNTNWKSAFATGQEAQIVFMSVSPATNPNNEIGMETHKFDQIIFVVEGHGDATLNGKTTSIHKGDMIFIPLGTAHNVVNLDKNNALKVLSVYTGTDIPADAQFKTKADEPSE